MPQLRKLAHAHWTKAAVVAIPFLVALTNSAWLTNSIGDADLWVYNGYFKVLRAFAADRAAWGPPEYFETRLPIIVPGALVYGLFSDAVARVVLNLCILHGIVALSFWYVVRAHLSAAAATAATVLLVSDIFYLRTMGWDYVDNAVLAYQALTFALLASARGRADPRLRNAGAGFAATSMVAVHFASALMLPIFAIYSVCVVEPPTSRRDLSKRLLGLIAWGGGGAVVCLAAYGLISVIALHGPFLFWLEQLRAGQRVTTARWTADLSILAMSGYWLVVHGAVLVASALALAIHRWRTGEPPSRLARFCFLTTTGLYALLIVGEGTKHSYFLGRAGLYASSFLFLSYLTVAVLLFGSRPTKPWVVYLVLALFPGLAIAKLAMGNGLGLAAQHPTPMVAVAAAMAIALVIAFATKGRTAFVGALALFGLSTLLVRWPFERDDSIVEARNFALTGGVPPRVFYKESEPQRNVFISITSGLTDHAMADHYGDRSRPIAPGDRIVVLDSRIPSDSIDAFPCSIQGLRPTGSRQFDRRHLGVGVHLFEALSYVPRAEVRCPSAFESDPRFSLLVRYAATALPRGVGEISGDRILAVEGSSLPGSLTRGPFLHLREGTYRVTLHYSAIQRAGRLHRWAIVGVEGAEPRLIAEGQLPDTAGQPSTLSAAFRLPGALDGLEATTSFAGAGEVSLSAITIAQRLAAQE